MSAKHVHNVFVAFWPKCWYNQPKHFKAFETPRENSLFMFRTLDHHLTLTEQLLLRKEEETKAQGRNSENSSLFAKRPLPYTTPF